MRKIFIALSVLAVLGFSLAPVQANVPGARDNAPGSEFKTYFLVSKARVDTGSGPTTLLLISETKGKIDITSVPQAIKWSNLHFNFYTINSAWVADDFLTITRWATLLKDIGKMVEEMSDTERAKIAVTFEDADYYAGYIKVTEEWFDSADNIIASVIQLNLSTGLAASSNIPVKAYVGTDLGGTIPTQIKTILTGVSPINSTITTTTRLYEVFTGDALAAATNLVWTGTAKDATWFAMYPRYLINDANGKTYWIILRSSLKNNDTLALFPEITFHTWVISGAENPRSTTIKIRELSILDADSIVPSILKVSYPYIGQVNLKIPGEYDTEGNVYVPSATYFQMELFGWNWWLDSAGSGSAATNWDVMNQIEADAGTVGIGAYPNY